MKQIKFNSGGQPFFNSDFALQQTELYKAIENQFIGSGGFAFSGCVVTGNNISAGLVYLDGKVRELASATGLTFPCYIRAAPQIDYDNRTHTEDNQNKSTKSEFNAQITNTLPVGVDFITVTALGLDKRIQYLLRNDQNGQFATDGFGLNAGKVSYVEASRTTNQTLSLGANLVSWASETDDLSEFDATNSEFTASRSGIYAISASARVDITNTSGFVVTLQFWNGSAWVTFANSLNNTQGIQSAITTTGYKKLNASQRIRGIVEAFGSGFGPLQFAYLSIVRVG